ncbi:MAG: glycoside hydrolase family 3 C-terminal domain-containing protein [Clostridia bacterium]|nr:glycoside hydrolase family 3 C-terminal domain-containing protein [Clostridia bacterium]
MSKKNKIVTKKSAKRLTAGLVIVMVILLAIMIALPFVANYFDGVLRDFIGTSSSGETEGEMAYNNPAYDSFDDLYAAEQKYMREAAGEGFVLLKNDGGLPVQTSAESKAKIAFFSQSSVDFVIGGTGSGTSSSDVTLKQAFEDCNFDVNEDLWNYYSSSGKSRGTVDIFGNSDWSINEVPWSTLQEKVNNFSGILSNNTTAVFIMSRVGGESHDEARYMANYTDIEADKSKSYLEPDSVELDIIDNLNKNFSNVILVVNTSNMMELGWTEQYENVKSIIWAPAGGDQAAYGLADIISGTTTPSGHLVDTMAYSAFSSPAMQNMGDIRYTYNSKDIDYYGVSYDEGIYVGYKYYETRYYDQVLGKGNANGSAGVYGAESGGWNYADEVQYPFGYGLSYTTFSWSNPEFAYDTSSDVFTITLTVTNTGNYDGKDVVQVYASVPYTQDDITNHIEKSAVSLVGYAKTGILEANGGSEEVTITVSGSDLTTYDDVTSKTYILEAGDYYLTVAKDAHDAVNNILTKDSTNYETKLANGLAEIGHYGTASETIGNSSQVYEYTVSQTDATTYSVSAAGAEITNRFKMAATGKNTETQETNEVTSNCNYIDRDDYLTRNNWNGSWPATHGSQDDQTASKCDEVNGYQYKEAVSYALYSKLVEKGDAQAANSPVADDEITAEMAGSYGVENTDELQLIDYRGVPYDEADWDALISCMTTAEVGDLINLSGYRTVVAESIGKPAAKDLDGPAGLNGMVNQTSYSIAYCTEVCMAATWNTRIAYAHGYYVGQDGLTFDDKVNGWYAPAMNIHRTPFEGRNFEYYSEDSFLSGEMASQTVRGAASQGMYAFAKHFALNEQEIHRDDNGVCTWVNEQAIREIYLRPFQKVSESGTMEIKCYQTDEKGNEVLGTAEIPAMQALMTSFNRVGGTWTGGSYQLIQEILRGEWGFNGFVITDYTQGATSYMHSEQMLRAGGDAQLTQFGNTFKISSTKATADTYYTKKAISHILYTVVNSNVMNSEVYVAFAYYILVEIAFEVVFAACIVICIVCIAKKWRHYKQSNIRAPKKAR